jgi:peptidoglycan/LPS O-acetylase OafA/YrhL
MGPMAQDFYAAFGTGSYFIYLWHIFVIMALRDLGGFHALGGVAATLLMYVIAVLVSAGALLALRQWAPPRVLAAWLPVESLSWGKKGRYEATKMEYRDRILISGVFIWRSNHNLD